ncbi:hypothetical protein A9Q86_03040 [Flavobacteriales bacterium 33_180_T64]|nr:hypothetical protein A9Q86_03040 [Flavobacteriales bacterium 33_180_T64]
MKTPKHLILGLVLLLTYTATAQQGINYKALIKDNLGNVVGNQNVAIRFTILDALTGGNIESQETHYTVMTDTNGIVIANIGEGTQSLSYGLFNDIDWRSHSHYLQVGIDITGGLNFEDMGTTEFKAVPYAKHATTAANVSGLEKITENGNTGWRLLNTDTNNYGDTGQWAVDLSHQQINTNENGATAFASFAAGLNTKVSGSYSMAMGNGTIASGANSTALGAYNVDNASTIFAVGNGSPDVGSGPERKNALTLNVGFGSGVDFIIGNSQFDDDPTTQNDDVKFFFSGQKGAFRAGKVSFTAGDEWNYDNIGNYSTAFGNGTIAFGSQSFAAGSETNASGYASTALGVSTTAPSSSETAIGRYNTDYTPTDTATDRLFVIGNGLNSSNRSNALTVLKNGTITAPSFDIAEIIDDKALVTKEFSDFNYQYSFAYSQATNNLSISHGSSNTSISLSHLSNSGLEKITEGGNIGWRLIGTEPANHGNIGEDAVDLSVSHNQSTTRGATGEHSVAFGRNATASGKNSTAIGIETNASGIYSTALGVGTISESFSSVAIGRLNIGGGYAGVPNNPGSTLSWVETDPLFEIGNGKNSSRSNALTVLKNGKVGIGRHQPASLLEVAHTNGSALSQSLSVLNTDTNNAWQFHTTSYLNLYRNGVFKGSWNATSGAYVQASDRRVKKDITSLNNGTLEKVMQLKPVSYLMKDQTDTKRNLGLISQEVQELFPSIVYYNKEVDVLALSYTELIPILIKALQEQQNIIGSQNTKIDTFEDQMSALLKRLENLEAINN